MKSVLSKALAQRQICFNSARLLALQTKQFSVIPKGKWYFDDKDYIPSITQVSYFRVDAHALSDIASHPFIERRGTR